MHWQHPFSKAAKVWLKKNQAKKQLLLYPTETFFALGCRADCETSIKKVYALKQRPLSKPLPIIVHGWPMLEQYFHYPAGMAKEFLHAIWPAPLTVVLPSHGLAPALNPNENTLAVRMSADPVLQDLLCCIQVPLVTTSANLSGQPPQVEYADIEQKIQSAADCSIIKTQPLKANRIKPMQPTTIIRILDNQPWQILRKGQLSQADLQKHTKHPIIYAKELNNG